MFCKDRLRCLYVISGKDNVCKRGEEERIYQILERKLWDDPNKVSPVRF